MSVETVAAILLIVTPVWFNTTFALLAARFDYPDILRRPTGEILERFRAGGSSLILLWWAFTLSGVLLVVVVVLLGQVLGASGFAAVATTIGVLAGLVQMLGLLRWVYAVPSLARAYTEPGATAEQRAISAGIFRALHQYLGVGVGEHLGYLLTGLWSVLIGVAMTQVGGAIPAWLGGSGIAVGLGLMIGSAEFLGPYEEPGWKVAGAAIPVLYVAWSLWLLGLGIALIA
jgi:hypothetical protein